MADGSMSDDRIYESKEREFSLLTISLYKDHPELWNPRCENYSNKFMRRKALCAITEALKEFKPFYNEQLLRRKINILRTNFNKEFRKREQMKRSGHAFDEQATLWYYNSLMFLKDESYSKLPTEPSERELYKIQPHPYPKKRKLDIESEDVDEEDEDAESFKIEIVSENLKENNESFEKSDSSSGSYPIESVVMYDKDPLQQSKSHGIYQHLTEYDAVGINVAKKLAKMDQNQAILAESIINNVLRRGLLNKLTDETDVCDIGCQRVKYTLDNRILMKKTKNSYTSI